MSVTPDFVGQVYKDTNTGNIWRANSTTPGDWTLEVQNTYLKWSPVSETPWEDFGFALLTTTALSNVTDFEFNGTTLCKIGISDAQLIQSLSFPNLTTVTGGNGSFNISSLPLLTTLNLDSLVSIPNSSAQLTGLDSIVTINLPLLQTVRPGGGGASGIEFGGDLLTTISIPNYVPVADSYLYTDGPISAATTNHILAVCVAAAGFTSGTIDLTSGGGAAPTGQGIADKATLIGRGVSVSTN